MLFPYGFKVKVRPTEMRSQEFQASCVRDASGSGFVVFMAREDKMWRCHGIVRIQHMAFRCRCGLACGMRETRAKAKFFAFREASFVGV